MKRFKFYSFILCMVFVFGLFCGCQDKFADPEGRFLKPKKLNAELIAQLKEDYFAQFHHNASIDDPQYGISSISFVYLGEYNGALALYRLNGSGGAAMTTRIIGPYSYVMPNTDSIIHIYKDGTFIIADKAYRQGIITDSDAEAITWLWNNRSEWFSDEDTI